MADAANTNFADLEIDEAANQDEYERVVASTLTPTVISIPPSPISPPATTTTPTSVPAEIPLERDTVTPAPAAPLKPAPVEPALEPNDIVYEVVQHTPPHDERTVTNSLFTTDNIHIDLTTEVERPVGAAAPLDTIDVLESFFAADDDEGRVELRTALVNGGFSAFFTDEQRTRMQKHIEELKKLTADS